MIEEVSPEILLERMRNAKHVLIGTHLNPDGDALGSALAISLFLDSVGVSNEVLCNNSSPMNLKFLPGVSRIRTQPVDANSDLGIVVDLDTLERLGRCRGYFENLRDLAVIDHHIPHEKAGNIRFIDVEAPATAAILARLFRDQSAVISPEIATCLICGIVTDTGSFRFRNTTPEALQLTAWLIERGGDIVQVSEEVFQRKPMAAVNLLGIMLANMKLSAGDRIAWSVLHQDDFCKAGATEENTEGLVNEMLSIETVDIAALLREPSDRKPRASIRSRGNFDVSVVARQFGGGGHKNAAGCTFDSPIAEAEAQLVQALEKCLESL